jgi:endonuclease YncB( thermonuclease family)
MITIAVMAALSQGLREFGAWLDGASPRRTGWSRMRPGGHASGDTLTGYARVVDGDSLELAGESVRLFGIDAPERYQTCRDGAGRDYACGRAAARALHATIAGRVVTCAAVDHDRYHRDVALCTADGQDLAETMVRAGHALELAQYSRGRYAAAEREARAQKRGLWAGSFEQPADWRRRHGR